MFGRDCLAVDAVNELFVFKGVEKFVEIDAFFLVMKKLSDVTYGQSACKKSNRAKLGRRHDRVRAAFGVSDEVRRVLFAVIQIRKLDSAVAVQSHEGESTKIV